jgi:chromosome segregation ATPase
MDFDHLNKRIQWVEDERRKEKDAVSMLENRLVAYEGSVAAANQQLKELSAEVTRISTLVTRMDQYDQTLLQLRIENKRMVEELDKDVKTRAEETEKVRRVEIKSLEVSLTDLRKELDPIPKIEKGLQARLEEEIRLRRSIDEIRVRIEEVRRDDEEYTRSYRLLEDGRRQDAKRLVDLQGEVAALRKRADDQRGQSELLGTNLRKLETRLNELVTVETERRDAVSAFIDKQTLSQVERERTWKEWQSRFEAIEKQSTELGAQLLTLDAAQREAARAQISVEELAGRVERRINEITEIQRLSEERFRQEWVTFKADDQKRWTNYTLTQEEQRSEIIRQFEKLSDQATQLDDELQEVKDTLQAVNDLTAKRLQSLLAQAHEWVSAYEKAIGRSR